MLHMHALAKFEFRLIFHCAYTSQVQTLFGRMADTTKKSHRKTGSTESKPRKTESTISPTRADEPAASRKTSPEPNASDGKGYRADMPKHEKVTAISKKSARERTDRTGTKDVTNVSKRRHSLKSKESALTPPGPTIQADKPATVVTVPKSATGMATRMNIFSNIIDRLNKKRSRKEFQQENQEFATKPEAHDKEQRKADEHQGAKGKVPKSSSEDSQKKASKHGTSLLVPVAVVSALLLILAFCGWHVYKHYKEKASEKKMIQCATSECKRITQEIDNLLGKNIHPCDDFYGYVCSKWITAPHGDAAVAGFVYDVFDTYDRTVAEGLQSPESMVPDRYGLHVMATIFKACSTYMASDQGTYGDAVREVVDLLNLTALHHHPLVFEFLLQTSLKLNIHSVFIVRFRRSGKLKYLEFDLGQSIHSKAFAGVTDMAPDTGKNTIFRPRIETMISNVLRDARINSSIKPDSILHADVTVHKLITGNASKQVTTYSEMTQLTALGTPQSLIETVNNNVPPEFRVGVSSPVRVVGLKTLLKVYAFLSNPAYGIHDLYHIVNLASGLLIYTAYKDLAKKNAALIPFMCFRATRIALTNTWPSVVARLVGDLSSGTAAQELATRMKAMVMDQSVFQEFDAILRASARDTLENTTVYTYDGTELSILDEDTNYTSWKLEGGQLFQVLVEAGEKERILLFKTYSMEGVVGASKNQLMKVLEYDVIRTYLTVPTAYQIPPLFYHKERKEIPYYINTATLGAWITKEMVRAMTTPFKTSAKSTKRLEESLACVKKVGSSQGLRLDAITGDDLWDSETVLWYYAFRIVYEKLKRQVVNAGVSESSDVWKEAQHYLFIRFCMLACTPRDRQSSKKLPQSFRERCLVPVLSNADFAPHFGCTDSHALKIPKCVSEPK
ncbi:uncharacterized protein LOC135367117 [Ornithodoros turicata]|uniref:uncharacterized protein LOC135367117 n=1 Tax=Ornithodoros turicata TaxID=34597 RepID=UPI00313A0B18